MFELQPDFSLSPARPQPDRNLTAADYSLTMVTLRKQQMGHYTNHSVKF